jgi:hypothetical protein
VGNRLSLIKSTTYVGIREEGDPVVRLLHEKSFWKRQTELQVTVFYEPMNEGKGSRDKAGRQHSSN